MASDNILKFLKSPQQLIAEAELMKLLDVAQMRPLTLDEVKIYDILCKNLNIETEKESKDLEAQYQILQQGQKQIPEAELLKIAKESKPDNEST